MVIAIVLTGCIYSSYLCKTGIATTNLWTRKLGLRKIKWLAPGPELLSSKTRKHTQVCLTPQPCSSQRTLQTPHFRPNLRFPILDAFKSNETYFVKGLSLEESIQSYCPAPHEGGGGLWTGKGKGVTVPPPHHTFAFWSNPSRVLPGISF